jgi:hypothetical protein
MFTAGGNNPSGFFMLKNFRNPTTGEIFNDFSPELKKEIEKLKLPEKGARFKLIESMFNPVKMGQAETDSPSKDEVSIDHRFMRVGAKSWRAVSTIFDPYKNEYVIITAGMNLKRTGRGQSVDSPLIQFQAKSGQLPLTKNPDNDRLYIFLMVSGWVSNSPLYEGESPVMSRNLTDQKIRCHFIDVDSAVKKNVEQGKSLKDALDLIYSKEIDLDVHYGVAMELGYSDSKTESYILDFLVGFAQGDRRGELMAAYKRDDKKDLFTMVVDAIEFGILLENASQKNIGFTSSKRPLANIDTTIGPKSIGRYRALIEHLVSDEGSSDRAKLELELQSFTLGEQPKVNTKTTGKKNTAAAAPAPETKTSEPEKKSGEEDEEEF